MLSDPVEAIAHRAQPRDGRRRSPYERCCFRDRIGGAFLLTRFRIQRSVADPLEDGEGLSVERTEAVLH